MSLYALLDCNNFYASCERAFNPKLQRKPIVVLSNNDGCIIARSNEAKALGIPMGEPYYKAKHIIEKNDVAVFSSNYTLYGDMSRRVMATVAGFTDDIEIYSIDEVFINLTNYKNPEKFARDIQRSVTKWTGIPVSIGIGTSKTLAKIANHIAKKYTAYERVFYIDTEERRQKVLKATNIEDVWGVGRRLSKKLNSFGINNAYELSIQSDAWIRKSMSVVGLKTAEELRGKSCIKLNKSPSAKKMITVSRSFGKKIFEKESVKEALANFTERAGEKLRKEKQLTKGAYISLYRHLAATGIKNYKDTAFIEFNYPTDSTLDLMRHAIKAFDNIYLENEGYKKCSITLFQMTPKSKFVKDFFDERDTVKHDLIMQTIDSINKKIGSNTIQIATSNGNGAWIAKKDLKSLCYTTRWNELPTVS
jgi:DNA polymerase V